MYFFSWYKHDYSVAVVLFIAKIMQIDAIVVFILKNQTETRIKRIH